MNVLAQEDHKGHRYEPTKPIALLDVRNIADARTMRCCKQRCTAQFSEANVVGIRQEYVHNRTETDKLQFLINACTAMIDWTRDDKKMKCYLLGRHVCFNAYAILHGCSPGKLRHARGLAERKQSAGTHGNVGGSRQSPDKEAVLAWLKDLSEHEGDVRSARDIVVPQYMGDWEGVYRFFLSDHPDLNISKNYFCELRREHFPHLHIRHRDDFAHCDDCEALHQLLRGVKTPADNDRVTAKLQAHVCAARHERMLEQRCELEARKGEILHIMCDGSKPVHLPYEQHKPEVGLALGAPFNISLFPFCRVWCAIQG